MTYALLIYEEESKFHGLAEEERNKIYAQHMAFGQKHGAKIRGGEELKPVSTATTVRVENGKVLTTDGPFAETREQLGGFYLIEAADLDEAIAVAAEMPGSGCVEVRPVNPH
jgi:hypothetical protein